VYSSETGAWSTPTSIHIGCASYFDAWRGAIVGDEIYFTLSRSTVIVKYDWSKNCLSVIDPPPLVPKVYRYSVALMEMEDSSLGLAAIDDSSLHIWSRKVNTEGAAEWVQCRVIDLEKIMPMAKPCDGDGAYVVGFPEGVDVIFVNTDVGLFTMELKSGRVRKVDEPGICYSVLPYMSFYTPGMVLALASLFCILQLPYVPVKDQDHALAKIIKYALKLVPVLSCCLSSDFLGT